MRRSTVKFMVRINNSSSSSEFIAVEAASGILLIVASLVALIWANSPWHTLYVDLWHTPLGFNLGRVAFSRDFHFWISDGLMTVFFFVVGLEIRREIHSGEMSSLRRAALPVAAAFGGMVVPAGLFVMLNFGHASSVGWAIPVATDIAFAVGVLALLRNRVPPAVRILLLALAVIDDIGAIAVIAFFYSHNIVVSGFLIMGLAIVTIVLLQILRVRLSVAYVLAGALMWYGAYRAGIHPTLAGVIAGLLVPAKDRDGVSLIDRLIDVLHGWVAFGIMPLFAFANAGIVLGDLTLDGDGGRLFWGIAFGLVIGKPVGIVAASWISTRIHIASLPADVGWSHVSLLGMVGAIGFTMALFIAQLAFPPGPLLEAAKFAILFSSAWAVVIALFAGQRVSAHKT
jgi:Na+:H+ antiporter, NhaA family